MIPIETNMGLKDQLSVHFGSASQNLLRTAPTKNVWCQSCLIFVQSASHEMSPMIRDCIERRVLALTICLISSPSGCANVLCALLSLYLFNCSSAVIVLIQLFQLSIQSTFYRFRFIDEITFQLRLNFTNRYIVLILCLKSIKLVID